MGLAGLVSAALVVGVVEPAAAAGPAVAEADPPVSVSPADIAPLTSPVLDTTPTSAAQGQVDLPSPEPTVEPVTPVSSTTGFDKATSTMVSQDADTTVYKNADGTFTTVLDTEVQRVQNASGAWVDSSTTVQAAAGGAGKVKDHPLSPQFAASGDSDQLLQVSNDGAKAKISLIGARPSKLTRHGDVAEYADVLPGADLKYEVTSGSVKESVVLDAAPKEEVTFQWRITGSGFTVREGQ